MHLLHKKTRFPIYTFHIGVLIFEVHSCVKLSLILKTVKSSVDDGANARENDHFRGKYGHDTTHDDG